METYPQFGKQQFMPGVGKFIDLEKYKLGIRREKEGWYLVVLDEQTEANDEEIQKGEYFQTGKSNSLVILPSVPAKPLVFKGNKLFVTPRQKLTFFLKIPLNLQVYFSKYLPENLLKEISITRLSDTWFGAPDSGEPAFALESNFYLNMGKMETSALEAICPVTIFNNSPGILEVERFVIRTDNLTLYKNEKIITSIVEIEYKGKDIISSAEYRHSKLFHGEKPEVLGKPRNASGRSLLKMNFHFIKNIYKSE